MNPDTQTTLQNALNSVLSSVGSAISQSINPQPAPTQTSDPQSYTLKATGDSTMWIMMIAVAVGAYLLAKK